eukprot:TRINITY_DN3371_c0_g1_i2.p1 TRINITY_DN3371_c0_g1~~TRINITY_DN3371_c0_g1_i2.p1  ORF type:complete len:133 (+),score=36.98 TRINITY_DN3371_c0_g1_i2:170-568(+)
MLGKVSGIVAVSMIHCFRQSSFQTVLNVFFCVFFKSGARNQFTFYYRFGEFEACLKKFSGWSECIKMKSWSEREVSEYLNAKYPQKVEEKTAHPVFGPFRTHPPPMWALEQKEKEQEVNVNPSLGDVLNKKM